MASPADNQTVYRVITFFSKRPDLTDEEFSHHWEKVHAPLVMPWALKHGFIGYVQVRLPPCILTNIVVLSTLNTNMRKYHTPTAMRDALSDVMTPEWRNGINYNGAAFMDVVSYEAYVKAYSDPYYINVIEPDERNFVAKEFDGKKQVLKAMSTMGVCKTMVSGGKPQIEYEPRDI